MKTIIVKIRKYTYNCVWHISGGKAWDGGGIDRSYGWAKGDGKGGGI